MVAISFLVWFCLAFAFSKYLVRVMNLDRISIYMLILYSFSTAVINCVNAYFALNYEYQKFLAISAVNAIGNILISIYLINTVYSSQRYLGRIIGTTLPAFVISVFIMCRFFLKSKPRNCKEFWKWGLHYSLPIIPHGISQVILNQFDRIMIQNIIGASQAGVYSFAYNIYSIIQVTTTSLDSAWEPWFYEKMNSKDYKAIYKRSSQYILGIMLFTILVMLASPELITILGSKPYWDAKYSVLPIIGAGFFSFLYTIPSAIEYYYSKTKYIALGTSGAAFLNIILNFIFIYKYGYIAAAYTTLFTYFIYFLMHFKIAKMIFKEQIFNVKVIVFSIISVLITIVISLIFINDLLIRLSIGVIILIIAIYYEESSIGFVKRRLKRGI